MRSLIASVLFMVGFACVAGLGVMFLRRQVGLPQTLLQRIVIFIGSAACTVATVVLIAVLFGDRHYGGPGRVLHAAFFTATTAAVAGAVGAWRVSARPRTALAGVSAGGFLMLAYLALILVLLRGL